MKCKRHPLEDGAGVCACCLRDRLLAIVAAPPLDSPSALSEQQAQQQQQPQPLPHPFPSSLSPLACRRRSDASACRLPHLSSGTIEAGSSSAVGQLAGSTKFPILSALFCHHNQPRAEEAKPDPRSPKSPRPGHWLSGLIQGRGKNKKKISRLSSADDAVVRSRRYSHGRERGLSPEPGGSAPESGYNTESPGWWRPTPSPRRRETAEHHHHGRGLAGFAVCLSPLLRPGGPSPKRFQGADLGFSSDLQRGLSPRHHRQSAGGEPALCPNRSRKLADLGRLR